MGRLLALFYRFAGAGFDEYYSRYQRRQSGHFHQRQRLIKQ